MSRDFGRTQRVADFVRKELGQLLQFEMRDPRVGMVSITDVEVSRDLAHARVYVTVMGCEDRDSASEPLAVLNKAAGFLRSQLAKVSTMRTVPHLRFYFDESIQRGEHLSSLIEQAIASDEEHHHLDDGNEQND